MSLVVNSSGTRADGRKCLQLRPLSVHCSNEDDGEERIKAAPFAFQLPVCALHSTIGVSSASHSSLTTFSHALTRVQCVLTGPLPSLPSQQQHGSSLPAQALFLPRQLRRAGAPCVSSAKWKAVHCQFIWMNNNNSNLAPNESKAFSTCGILSALESALESVIVCEQFPSQYFRFQFIVLHDDGSLYACAFNAAMATLLNSSIPCRTVAAAVQISLAPKVSANDTIHSKQRTIQNDQHHNQHMQVDFLCDPTSAEERGLSSSAFFIYQSTAGSGSSTDPSSASVCQPCVPKVTAAHGVSVLCSSFQLIHPLQRQLRLAAMDGASVSERLYVDCKRLSEVGARAVIQFQRLAIEKRLSS